jgi:hypothetical protein
MDHILTATNTEEIMKAPYGRSIAPFALVLSAGVSAALFGGADPAANILAGQSAFVTSSGVTPGTFRKITTADLPSLS